MLGASRADLLKGALVRDGPGLEDQDTVGRGEVLDGVCDEDGGLEKGPDKIRDSAHRHQHWS